MAKINILVKHPHDRKWYPQTIENELIEFQRIVDGYIETIPLADKSIIICNEEGWLRGLPFNCDIDEFQFCGTIIKCLDDGEEFASIW